MSRIETQFSRRLLQSRLSTKGCVRIAINVDQSLFVTYNHNSYRLAAHVSFLAPAHGFRQLNLVKDDNVLARYVKGGQRC